MKARGRRFETAAFGVLTGGVFLALSPWLWCALFTSYLVLGIGLQVWAERSHRRATYVSAVNVGLRGEAWNLFRGELDELIDRYRKGRS